MTHQSSPAQRVVAGVIRDVAEMDSSLSAIARSARRGELDSARAYLLEARLTYRRTEFLVEHYLPLTATQLNGEPRDVPDEELPSRVVPATGLQVMARVLGGAGHADLSVPRALDSAATLAEMARINLRRVRDHLLSATVTDAQLFDAAREELARLSTLTIAGADVPPEAIVADEAAASIEGIRDVLLAYGRSGSAATAFAEAAARTLTYLRGHRSVEAFDRYAFLVNYAQPLAHSVTALRDTRGIAPLSDRRPFTPRASSPYDEGAFDPFAFAAPGAPEATRALVAYGEALFSDTSLSAGHGRSCATCHQRALDFTDGLPTAAMLPASSSTSRQRARNTPTLYNAALQPSAFADARVAFLEDQIVAVVGNPSEMGGDATRLTLRMRQALAAYLRTLVRLDTRFDRAIRGNDSLSTSEQRGFNVFMGKARCGTCHFAPLFNGTRPPSYVESDVEVLGVPGRSGGIDPDPGAAAVTRAPLHQHAFRTPTVRNSTKTAPYMHNGVFATLEDVIDFYDHGGGVGRGLHVPNQTLDRDSLHLTDANKKDLIAFLGTLSGAGRRR